MTAHELRYESLWDLMPSTPTYETRFKQWQRSLAATMPERLDYELIVDDVIAVLDSTERRIKEHALPTPARAYPVQSPTELTDIFETLTREWKAAASVSSSLTDAAMHASYQRIIGLGPSVIPLILRDLRDNGGPWFWALRALTGENPVPQAHRGKMDLMTNDWLKWGQEKDLISLR